MVTGAGVNRTANYGPYGESSTANMPRFGYTGQTFWSESNLYYYKARLYSPALGRFLQTDPIGYEAGDTNLYAYVGDDPTNGTDPSGEVVSFSYAPGASQMQVATALEYLKSSSAFMTDYNTLQSSPQNYVIRVDPNAGDGHLNGVITWNPQSALETKASGLQSPAVGLAHEVRHAYQHMVGMIRGRYADKPTGAHYDKSGNFVPGISASERDATARSNQVARQVGDTTQKDYNDFKQNVRVATPTTHEPNRKPPPTCGDPASCGGS